MSTVTEAAITFSVPLPPVALRSNSRAHWRAKVAAKQEYSRQVHAALYGDGGVLLLAHITRLERPWKAAEVRYVWRYCGVAPDRGNLGSNLKALQDVICMAPNTGTTTKNHTTYLGLVEDDKHIIPTYELEKVSRRAQESVLVQIRKVVE